MSTDNSATVEGEGDKSGKENFDANPHYDENIASPEILEQWNAMSLEDKIQFEKKLVRKLDWRLIPWLSLLYLLSFLDRTNIGNAKLQGVQS